jgi:DNA-damage-inducible protein D
VFERGVDKYGFARIKSKGDESLFGGYSTQDMKNKLSIPHNRPLADFLPAVSVQAKSFANEITNFELERNEALTGEESITGEHTKNNQDVRNLLINKNIYLEQLPSKEDIKKLKRKLNTESKHLLKNSNNSKDKN